MSEEAADLAAVARARIIVVASVVVLLGLALAARWLATTGGASAWSAPVTLAGLVNPVLGYRLFAWRRERTAATASGAVRRGAFVGAISTSIGISMSIGLAGWWVHLLSGELGPLSGLATHVLLAGALWPTPEAVAGFAESEP